MRDSASWKGRRGITGREMNEPPGALLCAVAFCSSHGGDVPEPEGHPDVHRQHLPLPKPAPVSASSNACRRQINCDARDGHGSTSRNHPRQKGSITSVQTYVPAGRRNTTRSPYDVAHPDTAIVSSRQANLDEPLSLMGGTSGSASTACAGTSSGTEHTDSERRTTPLSATKTGCRHPRSTRRSEADNWSWRN